MDMLRKREIICNLYQLVIDALSILGSCPKGIILPVYAGIWMNWIPSRYDKPLAIQFLQTAAIVQTMSIQKNDWYVFHNYIWFL